jgi:hypothetical protein
LGWRHLGLEMTGAADAWGWRRLGLEMMGLEMPGTGDDRTGDAWGWRRLGLETPGAGDDWDR